MCFYENFRSMGSQLNLLERLKLSWSKKTCKQKWAVMFNLLTFIGNLLQIPMDSNRKNGPFAYFFLVHHGHLYRLLLY